MSWISSFVPCCAVDEDAAEIPTGLLDRNQEAAGAATGEGRARTVWTPQGGMTGAWVEQSRSRQSPVKDRAWDMAEAQGLSARAAAEAEVAALKASQAKAEAKKKEAEEKRARKTAAAAAAFEAETRKLAVAEVRAASSFTQPTRHCHQPFSTARGPGRSAT